ncbi:unnamed protein product [Spirodela intermedia]|uniref:C2 domain-containing protein n=1 Tax=Spirodela intermedia TaxID=51605 RepID=A0A7I8JG16_SPIIN|nr:unnamed protein product [Spirodela intermedia]CAA6669089.1 unnamed protein product [Spirodela intermedia]
MERTMDLTLISAKDLKDVNRITKMEVYAVAWLSSDLRSRRRTATDRAGRRNPSWDEAVLLHVLLRSERSLGDRDIGEVCVPLKELYTSPPATAAPPPSSLRFASYQVRRPCGKSKGVLNFSFKFAGPIAAAAPPPGEPLMAYPAGYAAVYPPPPQPPAYPLYPQPAYGYGAQPPAGYGFPPPPPARRGAPSGWFWAA